MTHNYAWKSDITTTVLQSQWRLAHAGIIDYLCPSDDQVRMIYQGMKHWEDNTCIRFKPRTNQHTYVNFFPGSNG